MLIGKRIKELRKDKNLTLTELSQRSGVQLATLSRIEHEKMTGTLESHMNIAKALGVSITELYNNIEKIEKKVDLRTKGQASDVFIHSDQASFEILTTKILSKKMLPVLLKIEPDGQTTLEQNKIGTEKFIYVLSGNVVVHIDDDSYSLSQNNTLYFDASLKHFFENKEKKTAEVLFICTPVVL